MTYLCVDGGQTKTAVVLLEDDGVPIHSWPTSPLTTPSRPGAVDDLRLMVRELAEELRRRLASSGSALPDGVPAETDSRSNSGASAGIRRTYLEPPISPYPGLTSYR